MNEYRVGFDIHKDQYTGCIIDDQGNVIRERRLDPELKPIEKFLEGITPKAIGIEACGMSRAAVKLLKQLGHTVQVANPKKIKDLVGLKKTDRADARTIAKLTGTEFFPEVYLPNEKMQFYRDLARHKESLTHIRVQVQNMIKHTLLREGVKYPKNVWSKNGIEWLSSLDNQNIKRLLSTCVHILEEEKNILKDIKRRAKANRQTRLLMTIPGVGEFGAFMILSEIADINRFKAPKRLIMYAGLCPGTHQTDKTEYNVRNYACNKHLKWILSICSGRATMLPSKFQKHFCKINKKKGYQIARRSTARKMATIIWHMLKEQQPYTP